MEALSARVHAMEMEIQEKDSRITSLLNDISIFENKEIIPSHFYITTAIHYTNGKPHVGHAYENVTADAIARYHRIFGRKVFFLTGTDEHGKKVANTAVACGKSPQEFVDYYSNLFQTFAKDMNMSHDHFIRTTSDVHKACAQWAFQKAKDNDDIYKDVYEGWVRVSSRTF